MIFSSNECNTDRVRILWLTVIMKCCSYYPVVCFLSFLFPATVWRFSSFFYLDRSGCPPVRPQSFPLDSSKQSFMLSCGSLLIKLQIWPRDGPTLKWLLVSTEGLCGPPCVHSLLLAGSMSFCLLLKEFPLIFFSTSLSSQVWGRQLDDVSKFWIFTGCQGQKQRLSLIHTHQMLLFAGPTEMLLAFHTHVFFFSLNTVCFCYWQERNLDWQSSLWISEVRFIYSFSSCKVL